MSYVPVPATTVARSPTASTAAAKSSSFSSSLERRALARRAGDDEPVGAVVDEVRRELAELVDVDLAVRAERRQDRGEDLAEHAEECYASWSTSSRSAKKIASENVGYGWIVSSEDVDRRRAAHGERQLAEPLRRLRADGDGADEDALLRVGEERARSRRASAARTSRGAASP